MLFGKKKTLEELRNEAATLRVERKKRQERAGAIAAVELERQKIKKLKYSESALGKISNKLKGPSGKGLKKKAGKFGNYLGRVADNYAKAEAKSKPPVKKTKKKQYDLGFL